MKKILIVYATAGEGHKRAAFALKSAFDIVQPVDAEVKIIDALDYTHTFFKWTYLFGYLFIIMYMPTVWGLLYHCLDFGYLSSFIRGMRRINNKINAWRLERFLCEYNPDCIVSTHFLAGEVVSYLKRRNRIRSKLVTCVTDSRMHLFWFSKETDYFCVALPNTKEEVVQRWGFPAEQVKITGIPIDPKFAQEKRRNDLCSVLHLPQDRFTVLVTGGGFGVGPIAELVEVLLKIEKPMQLLVVCGHNKKLRHRIRRLQSAAKQNGASPKGASQGQGTIIKDYGFVNFMDELMTCSDVIITKSGGLICSEALAKELPMIVISPIPGQESRNCDILLRNKIAVRLAHSREAQAIIEKLYCPPQAGETNNTMLAAMRHNIRRIKTPDSSATIAKFILGMITNERTT